MTMTTTPLDPNLQVNVVEQTIRKLTAEQWARVRERLNLCPQCHAIDAGPWCCALWSQGHRATATATAAAAVPTPVIDRTTVRVQVPVDALAALRNGLQALINTYRGMRPVNTGDAVCVRGFGGVTPDMIVEGLERILEP